MKAQHYYAVCCLFFSHCWWHNRFLCIYRYIYMCIFTYWIYLFIYLFEMHQSWSVHVPSMSSLCWCQGTLSSYECVLIFPKFLCIIHLCLQHEYISIFISIGFNLSFYLLFCVFHMLMLVVANPWDFLNFHSLSIPKCYCSYVIQGFQFLQNHLVSGWAVAEFLVCWFTEFSGFSYNWGWLWLLSSLS